MSSAARLLYGGKGYDVISVGAETEKKEEIYMVPSDSRAFSQYMYFGNMTHSQEIGNFELIECNFTVD